MSILNLQIEILAREWVKLYEKSPIPTVSVTLVLTVLIAVGIYFVDKADKESRETQRLQSLNYQTQIQQLNQTEINIRQLLQFVESQKSTLRSTEDTINSLREEQEKLKPLVESDRTVVDAIFRAQEERSNGNVWRERWIGFAFGVVSSLLASFLWFIFSLLIKHKRARKNV